MSQTVSTKDFCHPPSYATHLPCVTLARLTRSIRLVAGLDRAPPNATTWMYRWSPRQRYYRQQLKPERHGQRLACKIPGSRLWRTPVFPAARPPRTAKCCVWRLKQISAMTSGL